MRERENKSFIGHDRFLIFPVLLKVQRMARVVVVKSLLVNQKVCILGSTPHTHILSLVARTCSLIFIVLDVLKPMTDKRIIERELEGFGIRLNKKPPAIIFKKKEKGGINMTNTVPLTHITADEVKAVLSEYRIHNADISFKEDSTIDDLIDVVEVCKGTHCYICMNMGLTFGL